MKLINAKLNFTLMACLLILSGCANEKDTDLDSSSLISTGQKHLYIASGSCNSGLGITTFTAQNSSRKISKLDLTTGQLSTFMDLQTPYVSGQFSNDTSPQSLLNDGANILMLTEDAVAGSERKIYSIPKLSPYNSVVYSQDPLAFTSTAAHKTRGLVKDTDGSLLFSKSVAIEKIGVNALRIPQGANPWVNAPAGACATSTTGIGGVVLLPPYSAQSAGGKIIYFHQGATAALNRLGVISPEGYLIAGNCLTGVQINTTTHTYASNVTGPTIAFATAGVNPTAMVFIRTGNAPGVVGKLIVSYSAAVATEVSNSVNLNYALVSWTVTETSETAVTLTNPVVLSRQLDAVFGISAMTYDSDEQALYVATASQTGVMNQTTAAYGYKVEKFVLDLDQNTAELVRPGGSPFMERSPSTRCITSMTIGN